MKNNKIVWKFKNPMPSMVQWSRLKTYRKMRGLGFAQLALLAGIGTNTLFHHEMGFPGSPEVREKICSALGVKEDQIYPVRVLGDSVLGTGEKLEIEVTG
jgi:transcriptional regulator with XRE-family HTH domain